jgi:hypothetical protein
MIFRVYVLLAYKASSLIIYKYKCNCSQIAHYVHSIPLSNNNILIRLIIIIASYVHKVR